MREFRDKSGSVRGEVRGPRDFEERFKMTVSRNKPHVDRTVGRKATRIVRDSDKEL